MLSVNGIWKSEVIQLNKAYLKKKASKFSFKFTAREIIIVGPGSNHNDKCFIYHLIESL
jgi:hypothetical protein